MCQELCDVLLYLPRAGAVKYIEECIYFQLHLQRGTRQLDRQSCVPTTLQKALRPSPCMLLAAYGETHESPAASGSALGFTRVKLIFRDRALSEKATRA